MSRVHRRGVISGPKAGGGKTYAQFQAEIAALTGSTRGWTQSVIFGTDAKPCRTTAAAQAGDMFGSSYGPSASGGFLRTSSVVCRVMQHALPSEAVFLDQIANGWEIFYRVAEVTTASVPAVTRNGYTSQSSASNNCTQITELIRWDGTQAWISNPSTGSAETLYTW